MVKHIYVSPHSDDVALSCGGQILANPDRANDTLILNIFTSERASSPGPSEAAFEDLLNAERTTEDQAAWAYAGVRADYAEVPEALLRGQFPFSLLSGQKDARGIAGLYDAVVDRVRAYPGAAFHFPAGFGNHVDHLACKQIALRMLDEGLVDRIFLYEDVPYSWLRFIRDRHYRALLRDIDLDGDFAAAVRRDGEGLITYLIRDQVPFPRGRKLFSAVYLSILLRGLLPNRTSGRKPYRGRLSQIRLSSDVMELKKKLLYYYESQIPMLFGRDPDAMLRAHDAVFSTEVTLEVSRVPDDGVIGVG